MWPPFFPRQLLALGCECAFNRIYVNPCPCVLLTLTIPPYHRAHVHTVHTIPHIPYTAPWHGHNNTPSPIESPGHGHADLLVNKDVNAATLHAHPHAVTSSYRHTVRTSSCRHILMPPHCLHRSPSWTATLTLSTGKGSTCTTAAEETGGSFFLFVISVLIKWSLKFQEGGKKVRSGKGDHPALAAFWASIFSSSSAQLCVLSKAGQNHTFIRTYGVYTVY